MKIAYITNAAESSGVGHQATELKKELQKYGELELVEFRLDGSKGELLREGKMLKKITLWSGLLGSKTVNWIRLGAALQALLSKENFDVVHATNQTLSFVLNRNMVSIVTVHDLIELIDPQHGLAKWLALYLYRGIAYAARLIAVSDYTADTLRQYYPESEQRVSVIHNGVGSEFHSIENFKETEKYRTLKTELDLPEEAHVILYVGSDHPRKNVLGAARIAAQVQKKFPTTFFIKVGEPGIPAGRKALLDELDALQLRSHTRLVGTVSTERLNELYNLADAFLFPSKFEGFGLPPLQAMAAGCPVVCSKATSLSEVVGDAALVYLPDDEAGMASGVEHILTTPDAAQQLREKGFAQARLFQWSDAAAKLVETYKQVAS